VALLDADDPYHAACFAAAEHLPARPFAQHMGVLHGSDVLAWQRGRLSVLISAVEPPLHGTPGAARPHSGANRPHGGTDGAVSRYPYGLGGCLVGRGRRESCHASRIHHRLGFLRVPSGRWFFVGSDTMMKQAFCAARRTSYWSQRQWLVTVHKSVVTQIT